MSQEELVYNGWLKVYNKEVNGRIYDVLQNYDAVAAFITDEFGDILMVRQFRPAVMKETLEIPAGCLDIKGESPEECLVRELKEETNLIVDKTALSKIISYTPMLGFSKSILHLYHVTVKKSDLKTNITHDEDVKEVLWIDKNTFKEYVKSGKIFDGKTILSYLYVMNKNIFD
ncbi:NUDIX hydrolase [Clostridium hydrogenum]|uniref:NUDIX hydrolase n=1 Tax=Clostridium hydrogenum TaxID=2855764 RepID=UPI001F19FF17|nr:NUDIX hydrolase [Clostridium hydrogenum]